MKSLVPKLIVTLTLLGCGPTKIEPPIVAYSSNSRISFKYDSQQLYSPATPEILDMADEYCKKFGKTAIETGMRLTESWSSTDRYYDFECIHIQAGAALNIKRNVTKTDLLIMQNQTQLTPKPPVFAPTFK